MPSKTLYDYAQARDVLTKLAQWLKRKLDAGSPVVLSVELQTRSAEQNAKLHACLQDVSHQIEWAGKKRDVHTWKRLLTAAWLRAKGESVEMLPAVDGHGIDVIYEPTSRLKVDQCSELIEYIHAWGAQQGVEFAEPQ